ncbi:MAG TPA: hypothetical protein VIB48_21850 [Acidimicrobiia bacterium]|jgi:hypothetical protein
MSASRTRDERGASLILAVAFMVIVGAISASLFSMITSSVNDRTILDGVRNREYAADAGVEFAIAQVRSLPAPGDTPCGGPYLRSAVDGVAIRVECSNDFAVTRSGFQQFNVVFTACAQSGNTACGDATTPVIVRAEINYQRAATQPATRTYVQSWSVNG